MLIAGIALACAVALTLFLRWTIVGQALVLGQLTLLLYAGVFLAVVAAFVRGYEEPTLTRTYGEQYERYRRTVPGWWPRRPPPDGSAG